MHFLKPIFKLHFKKKNTYLHNFKMCFLINVEGKKI